jgi:general stress protein YciG
MTDQHNPLAPRAPRGFAAMDRQRQREIASQGGKAAHRSGKAHQFNAEEARAAGAVSHASRRMANAARQNNVDAETPAAKTSENEGPQDT